MYLGQQYPQSPISEDTCKVNRVLLPHGHMLALSYSMGWGVWVRALPPIKTGLHVARIYQGYPLAKQLGHPQPGVPSSSCPAEAGSQLVYTPLAPGRSSLPSSSSAWLLLCSQFWEAVWTPVGGVGMGAALTLPRASITT